MKQKKLHRKGSDCSVLDPVTSPLSVPGETTFADDDPRNDVINMATCVSGHVTVESSVESSMRRAAFQQKQHLYGVGEHLYGVGDDDDDDDDNINVDSSDTESDADL